MDERKKTVVLVVFGGCSPEHEVSVASARSVLCNFNRNLFEPVAVYITKTGRWLLCPGDAAIGEDGRARGEVPVGLNLSRDGRGLLIPENGDPPIRTDCIFPVLHGACGEDGSVQGIAELAAIPLVGCGCLSSALCMDKGRAHALVGQAGIRVPRSVVTSDPGDPQIGRLIRKVGFPLFVKPVRAGSSVGISRVCDPDRLTPAIEQALKFDREASVEEAIPGVEIGCAVLGNPESGLTFGDLAELEMSAEFFDYHEKYTHENSRLIIPAQISGRDAGRIRSLAGKIYRLLDCRGFARVDFFLTPDGDVVFNEVNTIPGLTEVSLYPAMMASAGIPMGSLLERMIGLAFER